MLITFEGGEGVGKSTQARLFCNYLQEQDLPWLLIREPGGSSISEHIRKIFLAHEMDTHTELLLLLASRHENIKTMIKPALEEGKIVVVDRFIDSTLVYQGFVGKLGMAKVREVMRATETWLEPDLTFLLDIDSDIAVGRVPDADRNRFDERDAGYHRQIREAFLSIARDGRFRRIDVSLDKQTVTRLIIEHFLAVRCK